MSFILLGYNGIPSKGGKKLLGFYYWLIDVNKKMLLNKMHLTFDLHSRLISWKIA